MENTPNSPEALSQHFSRRASAARIAVRKRRNVLPKSSPVSRLPADPANTQKAEQLRRDIRHRAGASRLLWQQLTLKNKPVEIPAISAQPITN